MDCHGTAGPLAKTKDFNLSLTVCHKQMFESVGISHRANLADFYPKLIPMFATEITCFKLFF